MQTIQKVYNSVYRRDTMKYKLHFAIVADCVEENLIPPATRCSDILIFLIQCNNFKSERRQTKRNEIQAKVRRLRRTQ